MQDNERRLVLAMFNSAAESFKNAKGKTNRREIIATLNGMMLVHSIVGGREDVAYMHAAIDALRVELATSAR